MLEKAGRASPGAEGSARSLDVRIGGKGKEVGCLLTRGFQSGLYSGEGKSLRDM